MADQRITQLTALAKESVAATDVLPIADVSASQTKKVTAKDLVDAGLDLVDASSIDLAKLDQASATKLGTTALADDAVTAAKLADDSSIYVDSTPPTTNNFEGRGYLNSTTNKLQVYKAGAFTDVAPELADGSVTTAKLANGAVTTAKASNLGTAALADGAVTYAKLQDTTGTDVLLGRSTAGAGDVEEIPCTAAGRALLDDADATAQRATLGLGSLATQSGTFSGTHSGNSSGTNTGDQTITLTGDVTGSGSGSFAATISGGAVVEGKIASSAVTTDKVANDAITAAKLADQSAAIVAAATPSGSGAFIGQQWLNTNTGIEYTWDGTSWIRQASLGTITFTDSSPLSFSVAYPDNYSATITTTLDTQSAARVFAGPTSGADATPTFRALAPGDLPDATASTKGIIQPGTGLSVSSGTLNHTNSATAGTYPKVTVDEQGHVTAGAALDAADIPSLPASKIASGTFGTAFITDNAVTGAKLANYSTAKFGEALPTADYIGQIFSNPLDKSFFLWDGNVWQPLGISAGSVIFAGTYNATTNQIATVTTEGSSIGLTVGNALPSASSSNNGYYVVVSTGGVGTAPAPAEALAPPDLVLSNGSSWTQIDVSSTYVAQSANNVSFSPAANIGSTNVQAAIEEVSNECRNADNITSGTLLATKGGTGNTSYTKGDLLAASSSTSLSKLGVGTNGQVLRANSATATGLEWGTDYVGTVTSVSGSGAISVSNGTTTPAITVASASTSVAGVVQLSDSTGTTSSVLAATPTAVKSAYDLANAAIPKAGGTFTGDVTLGANVGLVFEGSTDDANETKLLAADPTADRTIYLPNSDGTLVLSGAIANADIASGAAIDKTKISGTAITAADTGTVTSAMIADGTIVNADINASAAIAGTKISPDFGSQNVTTTGTATAAALIPSGSTTPSNGVYLSAANTLALSTNSTGRLFLDSSGRLGLGTSTPQKTLVVSNGGAQGIEFAPAESGLSRMFAYNRSTSAYAPLNIESSTLQIVTGTGNNALFIDSSQRVGIGTTSPAQLVHLASSSATDTFQRFQNSNNSAFLIGVQAAGDCLVSSVGNFGIKFGTNDTERARIDSSGRLLVGTTSGSGRLTVSGNAVGVPVALTDGATITADLSAANNFTLTLGGNRTLANPSNLTAGQAGTIVVTQDGTGSRTLAYGSNWKFPGGTAPTLTTTANAVDVIAYYVESATRITARLIADVK